MRVEAAFHEGDAESLPFKDASFDLVISQFGHMFAPRPEIATSEMLRVLKPGGTIAFASWPPDLFVGRWFQMMARYAPPPPAGVSPPVQWGDPNIVRERLGDRVRDLVFSRERMIVSSLSVQHYCEFMTKSFGPAVKLIQNLDATAPDKSKALRAEMETLVSQYFENNILKHDFMMTRATKI